MRLLWHNKWIETPGYDTPDGAILIEVSASIPLVRLEHASGRQQRKPGRKVAVFLYTDGPRSTLRKARTKRDEARFTGDLWATVVLGTVIPGERLVAALASRVPSCAQQLVVHSDLVRDVPDTFGQQELSLVAAHLREHADLLGRLCRQNFLHSATRPPTELANLLTTSLDSSAAPPTYSAAEALCPPQREGRAADTVLRLKAAPRGTGMPAAVLGGGDYARTEIIPALRRAGFLLFAIANREPQIAAIVGRDSGFVLATTDSERAIAETPAPGLIVVATAHDSHTRLACAALKAGHRVFLEKPPTVTAEDVHSLAAAMGANPGMVEIGFNRRYHPLVRRARARLAQESGPTTISCVVKELTFEPDHWYFWPNQGTRITGNLCHWIDLAVFLMDGSPLPTSVVLSPRIPGAGLAIDEERVLTVTFEDGSILTVLGTTRGDDIRGVQEQIDIRRGRTTIVIDDLWKYRVRSEGIERYVRTPFRNKAHSAMYREGLGRVLARHPSIYPVRDMIIVSAIQIAASELAVSNRLGADVPDWITLAHQDFSD